MNVALFGYQYDTIEFFARLNVVSIPPYNYLMKLRGFENVFYAYVLGQEFQYYTGGGPPPAGHPHFPWGMDVEPD